jgi:hypothetical protein
VSGAVRSGVVTGAGSTNATTICPAYFRVVRAALETLNSDEIVEGDLDGKRRLLSGLKTGHNVCWLRLLNL